MYTVTFTLEFERLSVVNYLNNTYPSTEPHITSQTLKMIFLIRNIEYLFNRHSEVEMFHLERENNFIREWIVETFKFDLAAYKAISKSKSMSFYVW